MNAFILIKKFFRHGSLMPALVSLLVTILAACGEQPERNTKGSEQIDGPVLNSGPQTEAKRAVDATADSTKRVDDSIDTSISK